MIITLNSHARKGEKNMGEYERISDEEGDACHTEAKLKFTISINLIMKNKILKIHHWA